LKNAVSAEAVSAGIAELSISLGGTATGEHGIGLHKLQTMPMEHGDGALQVMGLIKRALDPLDILNPGKLIPKINVAEAVVSATACEWGHLASQLPGRKVAGAQFQLHVYGRICTIVYVRSFNLMKAG